MNSLQNSRDCRKKKSKCSEGGGEPEPVLPNPEIKKINTTKTLFCPKEMLRKRKETAKNGVF